jgi:hypothetical protein
MTEDFKPQLNLAVVDLVYRVESDTCDYDRAQMLEEFERSNHELVIQSGVERSQLARMISYVTLIGWPEDPFAVAEYDFNELSGKPADRWPAKALRALALQKTETDAARSLDMSFGWLIWEAIHRNQPGVAARRQIVCEMLAEAIEQDRPTSDAYTKELEDMVAPVRRYHPEFSLVKALEATILRGYFSPIPR